MIAGATAARKAPVALGAALLLAALSIHAGVGGEDLLCLAPALLGAAFLFARRYPGERLLVRLASRGRRRAGRGVAPILPRRGLERRARTGGLLMGLSLAVRPPPRLLLAR